MFSSGIVKLIFIYHFFKCSLSAVPASHKKEVSLMNFWDEARVEIC
jgi:hypothetical protein